MMRLLLGCSRNTLLFIAALIVAVWNIEQLSKLTLCQSTLLYTDNDYPLLTGTPVRSRQALSKAHFDGISKRRSIHGSNYNMSNINLDGLPDAPESILLTI
jgi:hypothetical protein